MDTYEPEAPLLTMTPGGVIVAGVIMPLLACTSVALRFYTRRWQNLDLQADDWTMLAGSLLVGVLSLILIVGSAIGALGLHSPRAEPGRDPSWAVITRTDADVKAEKIVLAYSLVEKPAFALIKFSIFLLYRRIFKSRFLDRVTVAAAVFLSLMAVAFIITSSLQCHLHNWQTWYVPWTLAHHCVSAEVSTLAFSFIDVATDFVLILLPIPYIRNVKLSLSRKLSVFAIFVIGTSSVVVGIIRMTLVCIFSFKGRAGYRDELGIMAAVITLSLIEAGTAVTAACTPTFRPLLSQKIRSRFSSAASSRPSDLSPKGGRAAYKSFSNKLKSYLSSQSVTVMDDQELEGLSQTRPTRLPSD